MRDGSRAQWLNDQLCREAPWCDQFSDVLDVARTLNTKFEERGYMPLSDEEVTERAGKVWRDVENGKLKQWVRGSGVAKASRSDIETLSLIDPKRASDGLMLLMKLRLEQGARSSRGETFCITPKAMAAAGVIPGWDCKRYARARDLLLAARLLLRIAPFRSSGRVAAQYLFPGDRK